MFLTHVRALVPGRQLNAASRKSLEFKRPLSQNEEPCNTMQSYRVRNVRK